MSIYADPKALVGAIHDQARAEIIRAAARASIRASIESGAYEQDPVLKEAVERYGKEHFVKPKKEPGTWLITIGAKEGIDPKNFFNQMEKCRVKKGLEGKGQYVLEQRAEAGQEPYGWHIHWLFQADYHVAVSKRVQLVYQCFQKYLAAPNYVDVTRVTRTPECVVAYLDGDKKAEGKAAKVEHDKVVRARLGIPSKIVY